MSRRHNTLPDEENLGNDHETTQLNGLGRRSTHYHEMARPHWTLNRPFLLLFMTLLLLLAPMLLISPRRFLSLLDTDLQTGHDDMLDVIIIGAGWSGMGAAHHLTHHAKDVSFLVLESTNRTGGRSQSVTLGNKWVFELGSQWIDGVDAEFPRTIGSNPVYNLAQQVGVKGVDIGNVMPTVFVSHNETADPVLKERFLDAEDCLYDSFFNNHERALSTTIADALRECGWEPQTPVEMALGSAMDESEGNTNSVERMESRSFGTHFLWDDSTVFVTDQNPRGYAHLLDSMVQETIPKGDPRVVFNSRVTRISYGNDGVVVSTSNGKQYRAKEVISTIPVGVLSRRYKELLDPVPSRLGELLERENAIGMRNVTKVFVQFPHVWWDNTQIDWAIAVGNLTTWRNFNNEILYPGSNVLVSIFGDPMSALLEDQDDDKAKDFVMRELKMQHPHVDIPNPVDFVISRHGSDENRYGAFSVFGTNFKEGTDYNTLVTPLEDTSGRARVRLAGEGMCPFLSGYTHGALHSGIEAAAEFLYRLGAGPDPADRVEWNLCGDTRLIRNLVKKQERSKMSWKQG